eukprot:15432994-Alexandrium_andersonii.AAC.1
MNPAKDEAAREFITACPTHKARAIVNGISLHRLFGVNPIDDSHEYKKVMELKSNGIHTHQATVSNSWIVKYVFNIKICELAKTHGHDASKLCQMPISAPTAIVLVLMVTPKKNTSCLYVGLAIQLTLSITHGTPIMRLANAAKLTVSSSLHSLYMLD